MIGMAVGLCGTSFNLWAWWACIGLLSQVPEKHRFAKLASAFVVVAFFAKIPLLVALWLFAKHVGDPAPGFFLLGLGLVYSTLVGWSLASR
jgi:hypothetical protein